MKYLFRTLLVIVFANSFIIGCGSYAQPTLTLTPLPTFVTLTPLPTLPTPTNIPTTTSVPSLTSTPVAKSIFDPFPMIFKRNTVKTSFGIISADNIIKEHIFVDNTLVDIYFTVAWREGDLDLYLIQPDGAVIDSSFMELEENVSFTSNSNYKEYSILSPQTGTWTMVVSSKNSFVTKYKIEAHSETCAMRVVVHFGNESKLLPTIDSDEENYVSGDCIKLSASVEDIISLTNDRIYVRGATIQATVKDPKKDQYSFELFDDEFHGDGKASDGIYANFFCNTKTVGEYLFFFQISGNTNWDNLPFTREYIRSIVVH